MLRHCFLFLLLIIVLPSAFAQLKYHQHWYFGAYAAMDFSSDPPGTPSDNKMNAYGSSASISDPQSGKLLFYTNGNVFWNAKGDLIDPNLVGKAANEVLIIPLLQFKNRYMVFTFSHYFIVDMEANNGDGFVYPRVNFSLETTINRMTAVKHCLSNSYWLITVSGNEFLAHLVHPDGRVDPPVRSSNASFKHSNYIGDFVSSFDGRMLAMTSYEPNQDQTYNPVQIFNFNKLCGTVEGNVKTLAMRSGWDRPHGVSFSPNDKLIYVAYGYQESQLVQYDLNDPGNPILIATSPQNFNQIACGPDGRLYITTHIDGVPSKKMDVVRQPNVKGTSCGYREDYLRLNGVTNFEVPNMVLNHSGGCQANPGISLLGDTSVCKGEKVVFRLLGSMNGIDSLFWHYGDASTIPAGAWGQTASHVYTQSGDYRPYSVLYACSKSDTLFFSVKVSDPPKFSLGNDTTLCSGDTLKLDPGKIRGTYEWSTGSAEQSIIVKEEGEYVLSIDNNGCKGRDTVKIAYYPSLKTLLGDAYFICEEDKELAVLDAGKGFKTYKWLPTNDTTQWIEVAKRGRYYVVVSDYRGCKGKDEAEVESRCDMRIFIPNAFTPNADRLNERFKVYTENVISAEMQIFNVWGECVFKGDAIEGWDGTYMNKPVQQGVYVVHVKVDGFLNKRSVVREYRSTLHLMR